MRCPNCGNEIGYMDTCPYCGTRVQQSRQGYQQGSYRQGDGFQQGNYQQADPNATMPVGWNSGERKREQNRDRHIRNVDTWGIMTVILLAAIFIVELLQVALMLG